MHHTHKCNLCVSFKFYFYFIFIIFIIVEKQKTTKTTTKNTKKKVYRFLKKQQQPKSTFIIFDIDRCRLSECTYERERERKYKWFSLFFLFVSLLSLILTELLNDWKRDRKSMQRPSGLHVVLFDVYHIFEYLEIRI